MIHKAVESYLKRNFFEVLKPKAILFDMDGVLFDSMHNHSIAWLKAMTDHELPFSQIDAYMNEGQTGSDTINGAFKVKHGRKATKREEQEIYKLKSKYFEELGAVSQMPFAHQLLKKVKAAGFQIFVVTGSAQPSLIESLSESFPGIFVKENIISAFDVKKGKPNPEPYLKALEKAGAEPWEAVVVENAPLGVQASSAAKIFTIGVNTGPLDKKVLSENGADIVFDSMEQLLNVWDNLEFTAK